MAVQTVKDLSCYMFNRCRYELGGIIMLARSVLHVLRETNVCAVALLISAKSDMHLYYSGLF